MFHVEMRQNAQLVWAFNLSAEQVQAQFLAPIRADRIFPYEEMEWDPRRVKLKVMEAPKLRLDQLGIGRGWPNVERIGKEVTDDFMNGVKSAPLDGELRAALKNRLAGRLTAGPFGLSEIPSMAGELMQGRRASEQLQVSEMAVWEMLHQDGAVLLRGGAPVAPEDLEATVLSADSWFGAGEIQLAPVSR